jgi:DNA-binding transcriptional LysR family regulator
LRSGQLVRVLDDWSPAFDGLFLYYPGHRQAAAAFRALIGIMPVSQRPSAVRSSVENPFAGE